MSDKKEIYEKLHFAMNPHKEDLSLIQQAVILAHSMNFHLGLQPVDREGTNIQFPNEWKNAVEGVYKFNYKHKDSVIQFRFVNNDGTVLYVNFVPEDSDELMKTQLLFDKAKLEELMMSYQKQIKQKLFKEKQPQKKDNPLEVRRLQPVYRQPMQQPYNPGYRPNVPLIGSNPYNSPFGRQEYVGPNSGIFQGQKPINPQGQKRPSGSRFDPIDPFGFDEPNNDFRGFNQFGKPFGGNGGNPPPFI